ncbi:GPCR proteolysis site, GPS, motif [Popillia japonica]|uniref:GPCR proteolysis site, GPS, motif n=1 Tax=Popillia japonica TaxID=7064 RepID=A0AAW1KQX1_POPJA
MAQQAKRRPNARSWIAGRRNGARTVRPWDPSQQGNCAMAWDRATLPGLLLFHAFLLSEIMAKSAELVQNYRYETAYACEGKTLKIGCQEGEVIKLIRANYGRFSITICNDHGNTDWSVNCMSQKSLRVLHARCFMQNNCTLDINNDVFDDPCPGTDKYLEVQFICTAATITTTNRPSPPWLITSQSPMWSTTKTSVRPPPPPPKSSKPLPSRPPVTATTPHNTTSSTQNVLPEIDLGGPPNKNEVQNVEQEDLTMPITTTAIPNVKTTDEPITQLYTPTSSAPSFWTGDFDTADYCSPIVLRSIYWNWTKHGDHNIQPCPGGTTGFARWRCIKTNEKSNWTPDTPDLSECRSVWLTSLEQRVLVMKDSLLSITSDLAQVTSSKTLYGGDMMITTQIIQKMTTKMAMDITTIPDPRQREAIVTDMLNYVVKTGSNLLDVSQHPSWKDLSYKEQMRVATSLLIGLEENAFLLADTVQTEKTVDQVVKNIMLSVRVLDKKSVSTQQFSANKEWTVSNDTIELPRGALLENNDGEFVRLVFAAFNHLEEILQWQPEASDPNSNKNITRILNSKIISASLGKGRHIQLREPVRLTLKHLHTNNVSDPSCVFWDYTTSSWSDEGCHVETTNTTHTICLCNHLTNFAILMDVHAIYLPMEHQIALQIVTYVGCVISIVCLILAVITFQLFRGLKSDKTTIHCNLCICLLVAEILFLVGISRTENQIICGVIAAFLHYFFLCAFVWMFFEGFQLYVMLIEVFEAEKSRICWYYIIAYGISLVIVCISGAIFPQGYGNDRYCWLKPDNYFIYSFVGPVILILLANIVFLTMAIVKMCRRANATVSIKNKEHSKLASTRTWLRGAVCLVFLLGLTWTFGLLYLNKETVVMAYVFALFNSLQGFFMFLFHCVQNEKVKKEYQKFIRQHSWLPKCLRCSKPNGGGGSSSDSAGIGKEKRTSFYGGWNGNQSGPNSHSTDNSVLSPHGTSNISFKSYSRDSGHGGSEQEESPRSQALLTDTRLNNYKDLRRQPYTQAEYNQAVCSSNLQEREIQEFVHHNDNLAHPKQLPVQLHHSIRKKNSSFLRTTNPWNHTYTEIHDGRLQRNLVPEDDPVYEEIERNDIQVSDMSDEDGKRQSDMSRQSSRSYDDHRPLIPYSPTDRNSQSCLELVSKHQAKDHRYATDMNPNRFNRQNLYRGDIARALAAVLDGETVVCHLEPPEIYACDSIFSYVII